MKKGPRFSVYSRVAYNLSTWVLPPPTQTCKIKQIGGWDFLGIPSSKNFRQSDEKFTEFEPEKEVGTRKME